MCQTPLLESHCRAECSQITFIFIALYTTQIVSKQLYNDQQENKDSMMETVQFGSSKKKKKNVIVQLMSVQC